MGSGVNRGKLELALSVMFLIDNITVFCTGSHGYLSSVPDGGFSMKALRCGIHKGSVGAYRTGQALATIDLNP